MRRRVPPGDGSQLTTTAGSFFSTPPGKQGGTALTEPRAHSRIHRIAKPADLSCLSFHHFRLGGSWSFPNNKDLANLDIPNDKTSIKKCLLNYPLL